MYRVVFVGSLLLALGQLPTPVVAHEGQSQGPAGQHLTTRQTQFQIPYSIDANLPSVAEVRLFVSVDRGQRWHLYARRRPQEPKLFPFRAAVNGEYWFCSRTVDPQGQLWPREPFQPQLRVEVDTEAPQLELRLEPAEDGKLQIRWKVTDPTLDPASIRLSQQVGLVSNFHPLSVPPGSSQQRAPGVVEGEYRWQPDSAAPRVSVRLEARDRAGNPAAEVRSSFLGLRALVGSFGGRAGESPPGQSGPLRTDQVPADPLADRQAFRLPGQPQTGPLPGGPPGAASPPPPANAGLATGGLASTSIPADVESDLRPASAPSTETPAGQLARSGGNSSPPATALGAQGGWRSAPRTGGTAAVDSTGRTLTPSPPLAQGVGSSGTGRGNWPNSAGNSSGAGSFRHTPAPAVPGTSGFSSGSATGQARTMTASTGGPRGPAPDLGHQRGQVLSDPPPSHAPSGTRKPGPPVRVSSSRRFRLEYELEEIEAENVAEVELWATADGGVHWARWGTDLDRTSPFQIQVQEDGLFGFRIVIVNRNGLSTRPPQSGADADVHVIVDTQQPVVQITAARYGEGLRAGHLDIRWAASDRYFGDRPISIAYSRFPDGPWETVATELPNSGQYYWKVPPQMPNEVYLRIQAVDRAGNLGQKQLTEPISVAELAPRARIRAVSPVEPGGAGGTGGLGGTGEAASAAPAASNGT